MEDTESKIRREFEILKDAGVDFDPAEIRKNFTDALAERVRMDIATSTERIVEASHHLVNPDKGVIDGRDTFKDPRDD